MPISNLQYRTVLNLLDRQERCRKEKTGHCHPEMEGVPQLPDPLLAKMSEDRFGRTRLSEAEEAEADAHVLSIAAEIKRRAMERMRNRKYVAEQREEEDD